MNQTFLLRRHWKLLALTLVVIILLVTVFGDVEISVPEMSGTTTG